LLPSSLGVEEAEGSRGSDDLLKEEGRLAKLKVTSSESILVLFIL
jgi:hypothetical protein